MTLNATVFPDLATPCLEAEFTTLVLSRDGAIPAPRHDRLTVYANRLDAILAAAPPWGGARRIVVAHSFGGMLTLWWLLTRRGAGMARIHGLVLIATTAGPMFDVVKLRVGRVGTREWRIGVASLIRVWNRPLITRAVKRLLTGGSLSAKRVDFSQLENNSDLALDLAGWRNTDWRAIRSYRLAMTGFDVRHRLNEITVPTIVLHGSEDSIFPPGVGRTLARGLPSAEFRLVHGAGHGLPLTHGEAVVQAVGELADVSC